MADTHLLYTYIDLTSGTLYKATTQYQLRGIPAFES
jgi:hypothetical protein